MQKISLHPHMGQGEMEKEELSPDVKYFLSLELSRNHWESQPPPSPGWASHPLPVGTCPPSAGSWFRELRQEKNPKQANSSLLVHSPEPTHPRVSCALVPARQGLRTQLGHGDKQDLGG